MFDPYNVLNIPKNSSEDDVKRAYKKLAREHHPDKGGSNEKFQEINKAYEMIRKKENDDTFNIFNMFNNFGHMNMNNGKKKKKLNNTFYNYYIDLKDVYFGLSKKFKIKRNISCKICNIECDKCKGDGENNNTIRQGPFITIQTIQCDKCIGGGTLLNKVQECHNNCINGKYIEEMVANIDIPVNVENGKQYVFNEWGENSSNPNHKPGDFIIVVMIKEDSNFTRNKNDLIYNIKITLKESIIGKVVTIPHFKENIEIELGGFGIINPNKRYTLFNKGMVGGDLHLEFSIEYPNITLTIDQRKELYNLPF